MSLDDGNNINLSKVFYIQNISQKVKLLREAYKCSYEIFQIILILTVISVNQYIFLVVNMSLDDDININLSEVFYIKNISHKV